MPLFLRHQVLFIHIPKCGGDTFSSRLEAAGDPPFLHVPDGSVTVNGHTPQHVTWRELQQMGWTTPPGFRVVTLVRHPVDRVVSAYRYAKHFRSELGPYTRTPGAFLEHFYSNDPDVFRQFDQHNVAMRDFVTDANGKVDPSIEVWHLGQMDALLKSLGLPPVAAKERKNVSPKSEQFGPLELWEIRDRVKDDLNWFESLFPDGPGLPQR